MSNVAVCKLSVTVTVYRTFTNIYAFSETEIRTCTVSLVYNKWQVIGLFSLFFYDSSIEMKTTAMYQSFEYGHMQ